MQLVKEYLTNSLTMPLYVQAIKKGNYTMKLFEFKHLSKYESFFFPEEKVNYSTDLCLGFFICLVNVESQLLIT